MNSNLSIAMAQQHRRDLQNVANAAKLARSAAPERPAEASPRSARLSFVWSVRAFASKLAVRTPAPRRMT
jgi:hypothetical protein